MKKQSQAGDTMRITSLFIFNIGGFENVMMDLSPTKDKPGGVTVIIGNNGAGKTTLLESVATGLSWVVARILREKGAGKPIGDRSIRNGANQAFIAINAEVGGGDYTWSLVKAHKGKKKTIDTSLVEASKIADYYRQMLTDHVESSLPVMVYYPVERSVLDIPLKLNSKHSFDQLDGYDNSLHQGVDFRRFFEWFSERDAIESSDVSKRLFDLFEELGLDKETVKKKGFHSDYNILQQVVDIKNNYRDRQLSAVRGAIEHFIPQFSSLRIERKPKVRLLIDKDNNTLDVSQLSQGEKSLMALVGDLARRLAMMNPGLDNPLEGEGVVLIDEVDMHLHPSWQRQVIGNLQSTFPNCQFVLTTHSPIVISDSPDTLIYVLNDGELSEASNLYGLDVNQVLLQEMDTDVRNPEVQESLDDLLDSIQDGRIPEAKQMLIELEQKLPLDHMELNKARILILRKEAQRA